MNFWFTYSYEDEWVFGSYFLARKAKIKGNLAQSIAYLLGVLNSTLMKFYLDVMVKKKDADLELGAASLLDIPIKLDLSLLSSEKKELINKIEEITRKIISLEKEENYITREQVELDRLVYELYDINDKERNSIKQYIESIRKLL